MRYPINDEWYFTEHYRGSLNSMPSERLEELEKIRVPHTVKHLPARYLDEKEYQMISGYVKELNIPAEWSGKSVVLVMEGAAHQAELYCNGQSVGIHSCGYTAFKADLSSFLKYGAVNRIVVRLDSRESLDIPPFGYVIDYLTYGGIYRPVYLDVREKIHFKDVFVQADDKKHARIQVEAEVTDNCTIRAWVMNSQGEIFARMEEQKFQENFHMHVPRAGLWDTEHPQLYILHLEILKYGQVMDSEEVRFGFRSIEMKTDGCYLNGSRIEIRGLNRHQSWPYFGYAAPRRAQRLDAEILKYELGCNAVRTSHYPQSHDFIDRCDELGLLVFTEIPGWQHIGGIQWKTQAVKNAEEMVRQYRNHPSIFMWGVRINESQDDDAFYQETNETAHRLDPTRPTGGVRAIKNSHLLEDVYTYNDFVHNGKNRGCEPRNAVTENAEKAYLISEFNGHMFPTKSWDSEAHRREHAIRHARVLNAAAAGENISGCFGWCMFDYNTHKEFGSGDRICYHGVLDMFRNPKLAAAVYASQQDAKPVLEISSTMNIGEQPGGYIGGVVVLTNGDSVRLYKNNELIGQYFPAPSYGHLMHPPIVITDFVGESLEKKEGFDEKTADLIKQWLKWKESNPKDPFPFKMRMAYARLKWFKGIGEKKMQELFDKYMGGWGDETTVWRFEAIQGDRVIKTVTVSPAEKLHLEIKADMKIFDGADICQMYEDETWDMVTLRIRALDQNGNLAPYCNDVLHFEAEGAVCINGPSSIAMEGGMAGCYVCTKGEEGEGKLHIYRGEQKVETRIFQVKLCKREEEHP